MDALFLSAAVGPCQSFIHTGIADSMLDFLLFLISIFLIIGGQIITIFLSFLHRRILTTYTKHFTSALNVDIDDLNNVSASSAVHSTSSLKISSITKKYC